MPNSVQMCYLSFEMGWNGMGLLQSKIVILLRKIRSSRSTILLIILQTLQRADTE